ncbi:hypothetical protein EYF80_008385 [Liparis tanakae]|uniref:Uncharacterized protein n=1 Tax=Liparis tanakae TaxID=230148 RepID=A0A4Z2ITJ8_9TELE|nr:hypothetical protein EYF80_008385 [Liparis tanakae]
MTGQDRALRNVPPTQSPEPGGSRRCSPTPRTFFSALCPERRAQPRLPADVSSWGSECLESRCLTASGAAAAAAAAGQGPRRWPPARLGGPPHRHRGEGISAGFTRRTLLFLSPGENVKEELNKRKVCDMMEVEGVDGGGGGGWGTRVLERGEGQWSCCRCDVTQTAD